MENVSPMIQQYLDIKQEVGADTLLFFRLGDFYELFFEDAEVVSDELELVLTARAAGNNKKAPMCGVPHHAAHSYIQRLVSKGYKVAIAQQLEDPSTTKGLVKRGVTKIITQGTNFDDDANETSYLASITSDLFNLYVALYDIFNNEMKTIQIDKDYSSLMTILVQHSVKEVLIEESLERAWLIDNTNLTLTSYPLSSNIINPADEAVQRLNEYLIYTQKQEMTPRIIDHKEETMALDYVSLANLECLEVNRANSKSHSLFSYLNKTETSMGTRLLKEWIKYPLLKEADIIRRSDRVSLLVEDFLLQHKLTELLKEMYDISRIATKIEYNTVNAQDLNRLKKSIVVYQKIQTLFQDTDFLDVFKTIDLSDVYTIIDETIHEDAPAMIGNVETIKDGVDAILDDYRKTINESNQWLLDYEMQLKEKTKIKNLKIGYSRQFGYYLEVSKGQLSLVKDDYGFVRRQTLTNAERFYTIELKKQEEKILEATTKLDQKERSILDQCINELQSKVDKIRILADNIAQIDCLNALSQISSQPGFVKPVFTNERKIRMIASSHPILEYSMKSHQIIANDFIMDEKQDVMILTGPNMGGKSTYMRQIAISIIMAQMGCYVKAKEAMLPLFDAIYTRMGASDDIMSGHSTFMIEMIEANTAISNASPQSLILFDEIGRGTSTHDGMSIASSILEYVATKLKSWCIFSTHYHELTQLANQYSNIVNYQVVVAEKKQEITFLYQVKPGAANRSYGIHVAALADLPREIIKNASQRLKNAEQTPFNHHLETENEIEIESKVSKKLRTIDPNTLTPIQALGVLNELVLLNESEQDE